MQEAGRGSWRGRRKPKGNKEGEEDEEEKSKREGMWHGYCKLRP